MTATFVRRFESWASQHRKISHAFVVSTCAAFGSLPGTAVFVIYSAILQRNTPLTLLAHVAFVCGGAALLVFGLLLGVIAGYIIFAVDALCFPDEPLPETRQRLPSI
jgi:hypothetical protein